ncbi:MAG: RNA polymerase sigma factor [Bacteroidota bacterium]
MDEIACINSVALGNEKALEQLYHLYSDKVYNTIISYLKNAEDAEEVMQDVFITIFNAAEKFNYKSSVSTWIYRVTVNKSLDFLRKKNSKKRKVLFTSIYVKGEEEVKLEPVDFDHPGIKLEKKENARLLFDALDQIPDMQKTAFILTQIEGLPQNEVAEIMNTTRKSVESLLGRAKKNLRTTLERFILTGGMKNFNI